MDQNAKVVGLGLAIASYPLVGLHIGGWMFQRRVVLEDWIIQKTGNALGDNYNGHEYDANDRR